MLLLLLSFSKEMSGKDNFSKGKWNVTFNNQKNGIDISYKSKNICDGLYASYQWNGKEVTTRDYAHHKVSTTKISDAFGKGYIYI